jgi:hypothetical protein
MLEALATFLRESGSNGVQGAPGSEEDASIQGLIALGLNVGKQLAAAWSRSWSAGALARGATNLESRVLASLSPHSRSGHFLATNHCNSSVQSYHCASQW